MYFYTYLYIYFAYYLYIYSFFNLFNLYILTSLTSHFTYNAYILLLYPYTQFLPDFKAFMLIHLSECCVRQAGSKRYNADKHPKPDAHRTWRVLRVLKPFQASRESFIPI